MYRYSVRSLLHKRCVQCVLQATIGIDFLSKTMYLEDRTVSSFLLNIYIMSQVFVFVTY